MCGRVNVSNYSGIQSLLDVLGITLSDPQPTPNYNLSPGAKLPVLGANAVSLSTTTMDWGFTPKWENPNAHKLLFNARAESIWQKPSFREAVQKRRCVVLINGFYEWRQEGAYRQAYYVSMAEQPSMAIAAIYEMQADRSAQVCLVTTQANEAMREIHPRMPTILSTEGIEEWIYNDRPSQLDPLMQTIPQDWIRTQAVGDYVNNARNNGPQCLQSSPATQSLF